MGKTFTLKMRRRTPPQKRLCESKARFNVAAWGRQSGKSTIGNDRMVYRPLQGRPEGVYWYVLQTYGAAEVMFNRYLRLLRDNGRLLDGRPNESERRVRLVKGIDVFFKSGANFEDLRGETLDGTVIDEMRQQSPYLWPQVIRPMLGRHKGWADIYSTPNGFDHFYDLAQDAQNETNNGEWAFHTAPSTEAWWWDPEEIASAKRTMSEAEFAQEILAEFRDLTAGKAYTGFGTQCIVEANPFLQVYSPEPHPSLPIIVGMDFNISPMSWTLGQQRAEDFYWFSELHLRNSNTQEASKELVQRVKNHKPGVLLIGDATGKARQRAAAGASDYDIIKQALNEAKIPWQDRTPESNPAVKDRVNTMNTKMRAADGSCHFFVLRSGCPMLIRDLQRVVWKEGAQATLDEGPKRELTHPSDSVGYPVCVLSPIKVDGKVGTLAVIRRGW